MRKMLFFLILQIFIFSENKVIFFKLYNSSSYKGVWNISKELTDIISIKLNNTGKFRVFLKNATTLMGIKESESIFNDRDILIKYAKKYKANLIIIGFIKKFSLSTTGIVSPGLGGWKMYSGKCVIEYSVINVYDKSEKGYKALGNLTSNDIGLTLLGGPGGSEDLGGESIFEQLEKLKFNSTLFRQTLLGQAVNKCVNSFVSNMIKEYPSEIKKLNAKIVDVDNDFVYVNIGTAGNIIENQKFIVYREGNPVKDPDTGEILGFKEITVAEIKIYSVIAKKFSKAKIIKKYKKIKKGDKIKFKK